MRRQAMVALICWAAGTCAAAETELSHFMQQANDARYEPLKKAAFLGIFTHVQPAYPLADKLVSMKEAIEKNPFITGFTLKIQWSQFHPTPDFVDFDGLEALVDTAAKAGKLVNIGLIPGGASPEWIYDYGVKKVGPTQAGARTITAPIPWDYRYLELYWGDLRRIQTKYADDPRVWAIEVLGHNYNNVGEEMHAPAVEEMLPYGWTAEKVLENWKIWIDRYDEMFHAKKLILVVSQNYRGTAEHKGSDELSKSVAEYFVNQCQGRAILMSHQLRGREDRLSFGPQICQDFKDLAPNCHELVSSLMEGANEQGSPEMTVYKFVKCGNPLFLQIWRRDADDPQYAKSLLNAWNKYGWMPPDALKAQLEQDGLYVENAQPVERNEAMHEARTPPPAASPAEMPPGQ